MAAKQNFLRSRIQSFKLAFHGINLVFNTQSNFRIQLIIGIIALILGFLLKISTTQWCMVILVSGLVLTAESINSSLEYLCDKVEDHHDETIKKVKDISAGAVLISSMSALIIGLIIFLPKIMALF
jgi:diacylglycerol kinase